MPPPPTTTTTATRTQLQTPSSDTHPRIAIPAGTLRLRAVPAESRRIRWAEDVIDNEGLGKKSSKLCCIYHPPREAGESSSESDSDSSSSDDSADDGMAKMAGKKGGKNQAGDGHKHDEGNDGCRGNAAKGKGRARRKGRNAYETAPKNEGGAEVKT